MDCVSRSLQTAAVYTSLLILILVGLSLHAEWREVADPGHDVYFNFVEGQRLLAGQNPYARVLEGDFRTNDKYATYFPLFYELSALSQSLGLHVYADWLHFWRIVFACFYVGIALLLFETCRRSDALLLGVFAAGFWALGRWGLFVTLIGNLDVLPIFFLLLSLLWRTKRPTISLLLFGLSLSLKQIGIFLAPLYLIWAWQAAPAAQRPQAVLRAVAWIGLIPVLTAAPFLVWDADAFLGSVLFSATRNARSHVGALSLDAALGLDGLAARLPLLLGLGAVYTLAAGRTIGVYTSCLLTFAVFTDFNSVFYTHYPAWLAPFLPTAVLDRLPDRSSS